eukprot:697909-Pyramimonas_sp.AAC.1
MRTRGGVSSPTVRPSMPSTRDWGGTSCCPQVPAAEEASKMDKWARALSPRLTETPRLIPLT